jgi:hypothetical protein
MATDPTDSVTTTTDPAPQPLAPLAGSRSQSMQRLQVGLFGLAAMILLVSLANIILTNAEKNEARAVPEAAPTVTADEGGATASDPLADAGVVPDMPDDAEQEANGQQDQPADAAPALQP